MKVTDFDFRLPGSLIASKPVIPRDECRLMVLQRDGTLEHGRFCDLPEYLTEGDLLLLNNTRVFPARLIGKKQTGGKIEILLVKEIEHNTWEMLSRERYSGMVYISDELSGEISNGRIKFNQEAMESVWEAGKMPLPHYIKREPVEADKEWYQTVYAEKNGSIAAPTAGLHFTSGLIDTLNEKGVLTGFITLHIGTGTFKPVRVRDVEDHVMDPEHFEIDTSLIETIRKVRNSGRRVIAVGTTTTRAIEGYVSGRYDDSNKLSATSHKLKDTYKDSSPVIRNSSLVNRNGYIKGTTDIFIYPGYEFKVVDSLITNFHLPESTPLMLTSALCGIKKLLEAYGSAISMGYRFFSYGDAMLIL